MTELPATDPTPSDEYLSASDRAETLEKRVQRLEDAVAALQDTRPLEERVAEQVLARLDSKPDPSATKRRSGRKSEQVIAAERRTAPLPQVQPLHSITELSSPPTMSIPPVSSLLGLTRHRWLLFDALSELSAMVRMFFDIRYHVAWSTRLTVIGLLALIFVSWWWLGWIPFVGWILDKAVTLFLAFFVYKALSREARRYQEVQANRTPTL